MKKSIITAMMALAVAASFTSCKEDTQPRLQAPTGNFVLYEPAENNFTYDLTNSDNSITLTTSGQPDYGVATPTQYQVQVSLDDTWKDAVYVDGEMVEYPTYYSLSTVNTQSVITARALELNQAITYLQGIHEEDEADQYDSSARPIWIRIRAYVADPSAEGGYVSYSQVYSNSVKINRVQPAYEASLPLPAKLYIIGQYQGWNIDGGATTRTVDETENGIGSNIFTGYMPVSALNASDSYFRFYSALGDWETNSYGHQVPDEGTAVEMEEENGVLAYKGGCVAGKGSWLISNCPATGWCKLTVDLNTMTVIFQYDPDYSE